MSDVVMSSPSRPTLPDTHDVSLSVALAYALHRDPGYVGPIDERAFYRALNNAARKGEVRFWGRQQNGLSFELDFGLQNAVLKEIDRTYFSVDDDAAMRGFDSEYNRINAFCFLDDPSKIQDVIDDDQREYTSYSNVRVERNGFEQFVKVIFADDDTNTNSDPCTSDVTDTGRSYQDMGSAQSNKICNAIISLWGGATQIPNDISKKIRNHEIELYISKNNKEGVTFSADPKTIRRTIDKMIAFERRDVRPVCGSGAAD
jgi:hypothetical protein